VRTRTLLTSGSKVSFVHLQNQVEENRCYQSCPCPVNPLLGSVRKRGQKCSMSSSCWAGPSPPTPVMICVGHHNGLRVPLHCIKVLVELCRIVKEVRTPCQEPPPFKAAPHSPCLDSMDGGTHHQHKSFGFVNPSLQCRSSFLLGDRSPGRRVQSKSHGFDGRHVVRGEV
jgi:hypothetical protein